MFLTPAERRLLALVAGLLASGYLVTALCHWRVLPACVCGDRRGWVAPFCPPPGVETYADGCDSANVRSPALDFGVVRDCTGQRKENQSSQQERPGADVSSAPSGGAFIGGYLDLNRADSAALVALPGIGPALAGRILARRRQVPFQRLDELDEISGIGPAKIKQLSRYLTVAGRRLE